MIFPRLQGPQRTLVQLVAVVVTMASLSFAAVPFYDWFCRVTGFGGTTSVAESGSDVCRGRNALWSSLWRWSSPWPRCPSPPCLSMTGSAA